MICRLLPHGRCEKSRRTYQETLKNRIASPVQILLNLRHVVAFEEIGGSTVPLLTPCVHTYVDGTIISTHMYMSLTVIRCQKVSHCFIERALKYEFVILLVVT